MEMDIESYLSNLEEVEPDAGQLAALKAYHDGDPEYALSISQADLLKELELD